MVFPRITKPIPISDALLVFTHGSSNGIAAFRVGNGIHRTPTQHTSAQLVELSAVVEVFQSIPQAFNLYTDSFYIAASLPLLETVQFIKPSTPASTLFSQIQKLLLLCSNPFFVAHIRAHTGLPGPLAEGNEAVDAATI